MLSNRTRTPENTRNGTKFKKTKKNVAHMKTRTITKKRKPLNRLKIEQTVLKTVFIRKFCRINPVGKKHFSYLYVGHLKEDLK